MRATRNPSPAPAREPVHFLCPWPSKIGDRAVAALWLSLPKPEAIVQGGETPMPIVEDYDAIAKRLRELQAAEPKSAERITELERWRDLARETARTYVGNRRRLGEERRFLAQRTD